jgi:hypothetical protein
MFMQLKEFKIRFGNLNVPDPIPSLQNTRQAGWYEVYEWVREQRDLYKRGLLKQEHGQKLLGLGLEMDPKPLHSYIDPKKGERIQKSEKRKKVSGCSVKSAFCSSYFSC